MTPPRQLLVLCSYGLLLLAGASVSEAAPLNAPAKATQLQQQRWNNVWKSLQAPLAPQIPRAATQEGAPVRDENKVLFRFRAPQDVVRVYLAGTFNGFANNHNGTISDEQFAMTPIGNGLWFKEIAIGSTTEKYKFVVLGQDGKFNWQPDSFVQTTDGDGNSVFDFSTIPIQTENLVPQYPLTPKPLQITFPSPKAPKTLTVRAQQVWVRPDQPNTVSASLSKKDLHPDSRLHLEVFTPFGQLVKSLSLSPRKGKNSFVIPPLKREGGFVAHVSLVSKGRTLTWGETVLSVASNIADDLRYGFYATYGKSEGDYNTKAAMLADAGVNAVEFYDYFPAHGYYAPREANYKFEPFGVPIDARDVQQKIQAGHKRNILSLAYVASYAASESIYRAHPYPMTDEAGSTKIFNGSIMSEAQADHEKKPKWFYLMNIAPHSPWHKYILDEFERTLDDKPNDLVSFDGFELDTYGDSPDTKFYAQGSPRNGDLLTNVLHDFVADVQTKTHAIKPHGLVSFNSVNEFGVKNMVDVTDFLFLEIWPAYTSSLETIVDICSRNRAAHQQRVVLKIYPATMTPQQKVWPLSALRRLLGATMTGAGSLMAVGEPDEKAGQLHALNTLYYPDHQPMTSTNAQLLRDYYHFDALMYGWTHGKGVQNTALENTVPDCVTRTYAVPSQKALVVQLLNTQGETRWTVAPPDSPSRKNLNVSFDLPAKVVPSSVWFASPDSKVLQKPVKLDFKVQEGKLSVVLPELLGYGTLILRY